MRFDRHCLFTARVQDDFDVAMLIAGLSSDHEFAVKDGKLYAIALEDCIVSSKKPLCQMSERDLQEEIQELHVADERHPVHCLVQRGAFDLD